MLYDQVIGMLCPISSNKVIQNPLISADLIYTVLINGQTTETALKYMRYQIGLVRFNKWDFFFFYKALATESRGF